MEPATKCAKKYLAAIAISRNGRLREKKTISGRFGLGLGLGRKKTGKLKRDWILIYDRKNGRKKSVRVEPGFVAGELRLSYVSRLEKGSKSRGGTRPGFFEPDASLSLGNSGPKEVYRTFRAYFVALWQSV